MQFLSRVTSVRNHRGPFGHKARPRLVGAPMASVRDLQASFQKGLHHA